MSVDGTVAAASGGRMGIGTPAARIEGVLKVTGGQRYAAEFADDYPDLHHAAFHVAAIPAGRVVEMDVTTAEAMEGVIGILRHGHCPSIEAQPIFPLGPAGEGIAWMQDDHVLYAGQPIALVVARTAEIAIAAADAIRVEYERDAPRVMASLLAGGEEGRQPNAKLRRANDVSRGDAEAALDAAEFAVTRSFDTPSHSHNPLEMGATIADWRDGTLHVRDSTQWVLGVRSMVAGALGIDQDAIRVEAPYTGGGFGGKCFTWAHTVLTCAATRAFGVPVTLTISREQMYLSTGYRPQTHQTVEIGADRDGTLTAIRHRGVSQTSMTDEFMRSVGEVTASLYAVPNLEVETKILSVNASSPTNMRAPSESYGSFGIECAMDELAGKLDLDPVELRRRTISTAHHPSGKPWSSCELRACLEAGAEAFGWDGMRRRGRTPGADGALTGIGMALGTYGSMRSPAGARVTLRADGTVTVASATHEIGTGMETLMAQIASDALRIPIDRIAVALGDTDLPAAPVQGASRNAGSVGPAVQAAADAVRASFETLVRRQNADAAADAPGTVMRHAGIDEITEHRVAGPTELDDDAWSTIQKGRNAIRMPTDGEVARSAFVAHYVELTVDPGTGNVQLKRIVTRGEAGRILNPLAARSQILGGLVFGIGMALTEAVVTDPFTGRIISAAPTDYEILSISQMPAFDIGFIEPDTLDTGVNPLGAKGLAELGTVGIAAAIANAVHDATGTRMTRTPMNPSALLAELRATSNRFALSGTAR